MTQSFHGKDVPVRKMLFRVVMTLMEADVIIFGTGFDGLYRELGRGYGDRRQEPGDLGGAAGEAGSLHAPSSAKIPLESKDPSGICLFLTFTRIEEQTRLIREML